MQFLAKKLHILGHIINSKGIQMDLHKVNSVLSWKTPNMKEQLMSFIRAMSYLAPNYEGIRIPMGILASCASLNKHWNWNAMVQGMFQATKNIVN